MKIDDINVGVAMALDGMKLSVAAAKGAGITGEMIRFAAAMMTVGLATAEGWDRGRFVEEMGDLYDSMRASAGEDFIRALSRKRNGGAAS